MCCVLINPPNDWLTVEHVKLSSALRAKPWMPAMSQLFFLFVSHPPFQIPQTCPLRMDSRIYIWTVWPKVPSPGMYWSFSRWKWCSSVQKLSHTCSQYWPNEWSHITEQNKSTCRHKYNQLSFCFPPKNNRKLNHEKKEMKRWSLLNRVRTRSSKC